MENNNQNDNSFINNEKPNPTVNDVKLPPEESIRLSSIKEENMIDYNPHNYQSYFVNPQIVGEHDFKQEHNNIFKKNFHLSKNSYVKEEISAEIAKERSNNNSVLIGNQDKSALVEQQKPAEVASQKEPNKPEDKKSSEDFHEKDTKCKDSGLLDKKDDSNQNINNNAVNHIPDKKKSENACCYIL